MYGAFDVVLYFVIIQLFWLLINLRLILYYLILSYLIVYCSEINKSVELSVREHKHVPLSWPCCINQTHSFDKCAYQCITISLD